MPHPEGNAARNLRREKKPVVLHEGNIKNMDCKPFPPPAGKRPIFKKKYKKMMEETRIDHSPVPFPPPAGKCPAIIGEATSLLCCGLPRVKGKAWCEKHVSVYCVKVIRKWD